MPFIKPTNKKVTMKKKNTTVRNFGYYLVVIALLVFAFIGLQLDNRQYKQTVKVVTLKEEIGNSVITEKDIQPYTLLKADYKEGMVLWEDREEKVIGKYPSMQIRRNLPLYEDMLMNEQKVRYEYLYELAPDEELLTFPYEHVKAAGRIPRPGDRFRIRGSYKLSDRELQLLNQGKLPQDSKPAGTQDIKDEDGNVVIKSYSDDWDIINGDVRTKLIFDVVTVKDMLNRDGDSIYEILNDLYALPKDQQEKKLADESFRDSLTPESLLLVVKANQVSRYVEFSSNTDAVYTLTVLSRDKNLMEEDLKMGGSILDSIIPNSDNGGDN